MFLKPRKHRAHKNEVSQKAVCKTTCAVDAANNFKAMLKETVTNLKQQMSEEENYNAGKAIARALCEMIASAANNNIPLHEIGLAGYAPYQALSKIRNSTMVIYYAVEFTAGGNLYSYRSDDDTLVVGDDVLVPVGADNEEHEAKIKKIEMVHPSKTPYPYDKMKKIIGRI